MHVTPGIDLRSRDKPFWRYRVVSHHRRYVTVVRLHPVTLKAYGHPTTRRINEFNMVCTGRSEDGGPLWSMVDEWREYPGMPGELVGVVKYDPEAHRLANIEHDMEA